MRLGRSTFRYSRSGSSGVAECVTSRAEIVMIISLPVIIILCLAGSCAIFSSFLLWQEIGEVNRKLSEAEQISYWGMHPLKMARVKREYKRLYPNGKLDLMRRILQYVGFGFMILLLIPLGFFN